MSRLTAQMHLSLCFFKCKKLPTEQGRATLALCHCPGSAQHYAVVLVMPTSHFPHTNAERLPGEEEEDRKKKKKKTKKKKKHFKRFCRPTRSDRMCALRGNHYMSR